HLGLVSAAAAAAKGFDVVAADHDADRVAAIERGSLPVVEPGLDNLVRSHRSHLNFSSDFSALTACDIVFISTDVPTDERGSSDLASIAGLIDKVIRVLRADALLIILCQVPPGFTRRLPVPGPRRYYQVETL